MAPKFWLSSFYNRIIIFKDHLVKEKVLSFFKTTSPEQVWEKQSQSGHFSQKFGEASLILCKKFLREFCCICHFLYFSKRFRKRSTNAKKLPEIIKNHIVIKARNNFYELISTRILKFLSSIYKVGQRKEINLISSLWAMFLN